MKNPVLKLENLGIGFSSNIFQNINATVYEGSITALMGVNGAGKSCLIKTLGRLLPPRKGSVKLLDIESENYSVLDFSRVVSLVLTEKFQVDFLRVDELIYLGRSPYTNWMGEIKKSDVEVVNNVMRLVGIQDLASRYFSQLSDGQKQKVLIARALAQSPKLLILDEPTTYLDIPSKIDLIRLLKKIAVENDVAIILSTHDLGLIDKVADKIWLMAKDGSFYDESPANCRSAGLFKQHFDLD